MTELSPIPPELRVEDTCDFCRRAFARTRGVLPIICPSCGLENVRPKSGAAETGMLSGGPEKAVLPKPQAKPRPRQKRK